MAGKRRRRARLPREVLEGIQEDIASMEGIEDVVEDTLESLLRKHLAGQDVSKEWDTISSVQGIFKFLDVMLVTPNREVLRLIRQLKTKESHKKLLRKWIKRFRPLSEVVLKKDKRHQGRLQYCTGFEHNIFYDDIRKLPQIEIFLESYRSEILHMRDDVDEILWLGRAFLRAVSRSLDVCKGKEAEISSRFLSRMEFECKDAAEAVKQIQEKLNEIKEGKKGGSD